MPALPEVLNPMRSPSATMRCGSFQYERRGVIAAERAARREAVVLHVARSRPAERAISPGCGVRMTGPCPRARRASKRSASRSRSLREHVQPSASTTTGPRNSRRHASSSRAPAAGAHARPMTRE
jgi:hypothetical protein